MQRPPAVHNRLKQQIYRKHLRRLDQLSAIDILRLQNKADSVRLHHRHRRVCLVDRRKTFKNCEAYKHRILPFQKQDLDPVHAAAARKAQEMLHVQTVQKDRACLVPLQQKIDFYYETLVDAQRRQQILDEKYPKHSILKLRRRPR